MKAIEVIDREILEKTVRRCRERNIIIPTFAEQKNPELVPEKIKKRLEKIGLWDVNPLNLYRITWKNEPVEKGGLFNRGNWLEFPSAFTGVSARIIGLVGKYFPTGSHKVGAGFGCLVPKLVSGSFDPTSQKAVWPSTGNYCRGGAFDCALLACPAIAILPEEMSRERFEWLREIGTEEIFATPGCESNVKEIYDKCWELKRERGESIVIFNQFDEFGNAIWHYHTTGSIIDEIWNEVKTPESRFAAFVSATGSAGTIAAGDYLRTKHPLMKVIATEALQCPTLLLSGFGGHRIEGIGDKHVPWIHNVRNTDMACAVDDEQCISLMTLFNEEGGRNFLGKEGFSETLIDALPLLGISSICNLVACIKAAKYFELSSRDIIFTPLTDSMALYESRMEEQRALRGPCTERDAGRCFARHIEGIGTDHMKELNYYDRKKIHNLKYFTWVEQQGKNVDELRELWDPDFWPEVFSRVEEWDRLIAEFNAHTRLLSGLD
jgi:cysteine synthase